MKRVPLDPALVQARNEAFVAEAARLGFYWRCADCTHVVPSRGACSMGYPNAIFAGPPHALQADGEFAFCKYFELGPNAGAEPADEA